PFFCLLFFGEAKKSKCPASMKRMVEVTPKTNHKAPTHFQAASMVVTKNISLPYPLPNPQYPL
ncbi:hypothetical protein, partial [Kingella oralis]|uniref:hypothetical protein n=1 Tax=Kingella oralis TaxID=505 RepID=UPI0034E4FA9B